MKQKYTLSFRKRNSKPYLLLIAFMAFCGQGYSQQSYTFTTCGATGSLGPVQAQVVSSYTNTNLSGSVVISPTPGIQTWTVPVTGGYRIMALGAKGFGSNGGRGASIAGDFTLTAGTVLKILVGQQGASPISPGTNQYGGGGGSFVTSLANVPFVIAGGGGGSWATTYTGLSDGTVSLSGNAASNGPTNGVGGTAGGGGGTAASADGGGGLTGNGGGTAGGFAFVNGGTGGAQTGHGGFGGGGGASSWDNRRGGGGGGYSGGGGAGSTTTGFPEGGGGGSINSGVNQTNISGSNNGDGRVVITELCSISLNAASSATPATSICSGSSVTLTTNGVSSYSWSTGNTTSSVIVVNPTVTTTYSLSATSVSACTAFAALTITVSSGIPVLSVAQTTNNICLGQSVTFTASGALTYSWTGGITNAVAFTPTNTSSYTVTGTNGCGTSTAVSNVTISPLAVSAVSSATSLCAGSLATLTAFAAATSYTWLPINGTGTSVVISPNATTIYSLVVSNGTCNGSGSVAVNVIPTPTLTTSASATNICAGTTVTLSASGAVTYTWFPSVTTGSAITVSPGIPTQYSVGGTNAQGCSSGALRLILANALPNVNVITNNPAICNGGSATLTVSGANSYLWSTSSTNTLIVVNPTQNTVYTVIGTDNTTSCSATGSVNIDVVTPLISIAGNTAICPGATATLQASGATSYSWSTGALTPGTSDAPAATTIYTLTTITNSLNINCATSSTFQVLVRNSPSVTAQADRTVACRNETVTVSALGANTYVWSNSATSPSINVTSSLVTTVPLTVTGTDANGCKANAIIFIQMNACTGLGADNSISGIKVYPNPAINNLIIVSDLELELTVISETGALVKTIKKNTSRELSVDVSDLASGIYFIHGQQGSSQFREKLIIVK